MMRSLALFMAFALLLPAIYAEQHLYSPPTAFVGGSQLQADRPIGTWIPAGISSRFLASSSSTDVGVEIVKEIPDDFPCREDVIEAIKAVRKACAVTMQLQPLYSPASGKDEIGTLSKKDSSPVTVGDFAAQAIVLDHLSCAFPSDRFIAEESSANLVSDPDLLQEVLEASSDHFSSSEDLCKAIDLGQSYSADGTLTDDHDCAKRIWTLDPIDGTKGFLRGKYDGGQYCIALAKLTDGTPTIGVLGCPNLPVSVGDDDANFAWAEGETADNNHKTRGCIFVASKGGGCYQLPLFPDGHGGERTCSIHPLRVTPGDESKIKVSDARFCVGVESGFGDYLGQQAKIAEIMHGPAALDKNGDIVKARRMDSQAKHGCLARGDGEIFVRLPKPGYVEWIWDHAAGYVVITEAGGKLTDIDGNEINFGMGAKLSKGVRGIAMSNGGVFHDRLLAAFKEQEAARIAAEAVE